MIKIEVTEDYFELIPFFIENDLEFTVDEETPTDIIKCWRVEENGELVGGCVLAKRNGEFICDGIATAPSIRGKGVGEELLNLLISEARSRGGKSIFLVARAPGFFAKQGFEPTPKERAPTFFECFTCPQYGVDCHPEVMRLDI